MALCPLSSTRGPCASSCNWFTVPHPVPPLPLDCTMVKAVVNPTLQDHWQATPCILEDEWVRDVCEEVGLEAMVMDGDG